VALREPRLRPYRLRAPGPFDLDEIARIESESFPIPWKREFFASELAEPHRYLRVLVSEDGSEPRIGGYVFAVALYEEFHINKIATDARLRRQGYGRLLLEDALAHARAVGASSVTLEVRISNEAARTFYGTYGFTDAYRRRAYYQDGEDAMVLVLPLSSRGR
jgi:ribosomal-protein-alanine N-acetyltransferase